jgi:hypothetical protein
MVQFKVSSYDINYLTLNTGDTCDYNMAPPIAPATESTDTDLCLKLDIVSNWIDHFTQQAPNPFPYGTCVTAVTMEHRADCEIRISRSIYKLTKQCFRYSAEVKYVVHGLVPLYYKETTSSTLNVMPNELPNTLFGKNIVVYYLLYDRPANSEELSSDPTTRGTAISYSNSTLSVSWVGTSKSFNFTKALNGTVSQSGTASVPTGPLYNVPDAYLLPTVVAQMVGFDLVSFANEKTITESEMSRMSASTAEHKVSYTGPDSNSTQAFARILKGNYNSLT